MHRPHLPPLSVPALVLLLTVAPWPAAGPAAIAAQEIASPYSYIETGQEAGAFIGTIDPGTGRFGLGPGEGTLYGLRYSIELSGPFSLEGVARTLSSSREVREPDPATEEGVRTLGEADALVTSVDGRLKFSLPGRRTWYGLGPYAVAGGGLAFDLAGSAPADTEVELAEDRFEFGTSFLGVLGAGVRWLPSDRFQIRGEVDLNLWQLDTPEGYRDPERELGFEAVPESEWVSGLGATVGIAFRW